MTIGQIEKSTSNTQEKDSKKPVEKKPLGFFTIFASTFLIYLILGAVLFLNFGFISNAYSKNKNSIIREAILQPQTNVPANEIFYLDPLESSSRNSDVLAEIRKGISFLVFSSLFKETTDGNVQKEIVKEFEFKEAKELTIKIYDNIYWHDGKQLTTNDILFTLKQIEAIGQENTFYGAVNGGAITYTQVSSTELNIKLEDKDGAKPNAAYLEDLTFPILPKHLLEKYSPADIRNLSNTNFGKKPIGSGKLVYENNLITELELKKNETYFGEKINFDKYKIKLYKSYEDIKKDYILKNIDLFIRKDVSEENDDFTKSLSSLTKKFSTTIKNRRIAIYFNLNSSKSKSVFSTSFQLRNNIQKIINRQALLESISGYGREIYGPIDQDSAAFLEDIKRAQTLDLAKFKSDTEASGYTLKDNYYQKDGTTLGFVLSYLDGEVRNKLALNLQLQLKAAGIKVDLKKIGEVKENDLNNLNVFTKSSSNEFSTIINNRDFEVLLTIVSQYQDPDRFSEWHKSRIEPPGLNLSSFSSIRTDFALSEGRVEPDMEKRKEFYFKFQNDFLQEVPAIYLLNPQILTYYSPKIKNIEVNTINDIQYRYTNISYWKIGNSNTN